MTVDPAFALPEPKFLWVYDLTLRSAASSASVAINDEGQWRYDEGPERRVRGYVASPDTQERQIGTASGLAVDLIVLLPRDTQVDQGDEVAVGNLNRWQDGRYWVSVVRPNASHLRVLCHRAGTGGLSVAPGLQDPNPNPIPATLVTEVTDIDNA